MSAGLVGPAAVAAAAAGPGAPSVERRVVAAVDQGTTSSRCLLFARSGAVVGSAQREHRQYTPRPGWVEHDAGEIRDRTEEVIAGALADAGLDGRSVAAVGITNQRETTVVWDPASGEPLAPAIVWQDTRTAGLAAALEEAVGAARLREVTGLPAATYFSGPKLQWLLDSVDGLRERAASGRAVFGTVDSWLVRCLTGGRAAHRVDATNASRTLLMDLRRLEWSPELVEAQRIPRQMLPEITPSAHPEAWGRTTADGPFGASIPITGVIGDQQSALLGQLRRRPGEAKCTYGTGAFLLLHTGSEPVPSASGLLTTVAYAEPGRTDYALEGSVAIAGSLVQWLRDQLRLADSAEGVAALAEEVEDSGGVVIVPAFSGLFSPYWRSDARGVICGLTRHADRRHLARAALEASAFQVREVLDAMARDASFPVSELRVDGGMAVNDTLLSFQADLLEAPVVRPRMLETTAFGAAVCAGLAAGFWESEDDLAEALTEDARFEPTMAESERERRMAAWRKAVERSFGWVE